MNFQETLIFLCPSYVLYMRETSDLFLGTPDHCPLHHYIHWWFDLFSMTWFEWISAHSFSFDLFVHLIVFHSPCLHCSFFISIYIPCSIFSTHHSYTSHQQFEILHFFFFIIDILILDSFFLTDIFILGILRSMIYETFCTYCILYMSVWGFIIGII